MRSNGSIYHLAHAHGRHGTHRCGNTIRRQLQQFGEPVVAQIPGQTSSPAAQAAKLRGILESAVTAILTIDDRGLIEDVNRSTERRFGYDASELIGQNVKMLMPEPYRVSMMGTSPAMSPRESRRSSASAVK